MIFLFTSDQYEMLYIYFFSHYSPPPPQKKKKLLEHVSMHMIKRKCNMYMEDREWEAIKQNEDKGIIMGTTITIKLKGQSVIFFLHLLLSFGFLLFIKKTFLVFLVFFLFYVVLLGYVHWRDRRYKGGACYCSTKRRRRRTYR